MKGVLIAAAVGFGLIASLGGASAKPWKHKGGHGGFGHHKHWKFGGHPGRGHAYGHYKKRYGYGYGYGRPRAYGYYRGYDYDY